MSKGPAGEARRDERIANEKAVKDFADSLRIEDTKNQFAAIEQEKSERLLSFRGIKSNRN